MIPDLPPSPAPFTTPLSITEAKTSQPESGNQMHQAGSVDPARMPVADGSIHTAQPVTDALMVSTNNPCPFLRGLVAKHLLPDDQASLTQVVEAIHHIQAGQDPDAQGEIELLPSLPIKFIASTANGISPLQVWHNLQHGVQLNDLRGNIFDKQGVGSRLLTANADFDANEFARLTTFASSKTDSEGNMELGLDEAEIQVMLDANAERAKAQRRLIDRTLMNGEFPILLKVLGKQGVTPTGEPIRYLAVADIERLFKYRAFPERIAQRIGLVQNVSAT